MRSPTRSGASKVVPDTISFHDIAGLVAGAHRGEGLGNQFLANIRETDAIVHVVRVHDDPGVVHPEGRVDPLADIETIETELIYADLEQAERRLERVVRTTRRGGDRHAVAEEAWLRSAGRGAAGGAPGADGAAAGRRCRRDDAAQPLTAKPVLFVANVGEGDTEVPEAIVEHARGRRRRGRGLGAARSRARASSPRTRRRRCARTRPERVRPRRGDPRRVRAAAADRVLHRRRGQAGAVVAPPEGPHRVARRRADPLRHPARLRSGRGGRRGPSSSTPAATPARGTEARCGLEGRDYVMADGDVITVKFTPYEPGPTGKVPPRRIPCYSPGSGEPNFSLWGESPPAGGVAHAASPTANPVGVGR